MGMQLPWPVTTLVRDSIYYVRSGVCGLKLSPFSLVRLFRVCGVSRFNANFARLTGSSDSRSSIPRVPRVYPVPRIRQA